MAKKKHLQGVDPEDMALIDSSFRSKTEEYRPSYGSCDYKVSIKCKNSKQKAFLNALKDDDKQICIGIGAAGSGKSYISLAYALNAIRTQNDKYKQIVILIPTCLAGHPSMNIGFLPGTYDEKMAPFVESDSYTFEKILTQSGVYSSKSIIQSLIRNGVIRFEIVGYARGKTFDNTLICISECENLSKSEMILLLTRLGENSKIILTGDTKQTDRTDIVKAKNIREESGVMYTIDKLKDLDEVSITEFGTDDIVRNPLITKILNAWGE